MSLPAENPHPTPHRSTRTRWLTFTLRWGIAVLGIWWVLSNISLHDRVLIASPRDGWPVAVRLTQPARDNDRQFMVEWPDDGVRTLNRSELLVRADPVHVTVIEHGQLVRYDQLARQVVPGKKRDDWPILVTRPRNLWQRFWNLHTGEVKPIDPAEVVGPRESAVPYPIIEQGLLPMVRNADARFLWSAVGIFPLVYIITSWRWHSLLRALSIQIPLRRAFTLNMVGAFYNSFMPGSTGGDLLKAWYIAKHTKLRTRAVMSVIVDRILGMLALVIMGGVMAAVQFFRLSPGEPERLWCGRVAFGSLLILIATGVALFVFYNPMLRRLCGLDFVIRRLPMQTQVNKAVEAMEIYRRQPGLVLWALIITFPVHATVVVSATFAGMAFGLPLHPLYYWVVVPVVVLSGAIPISPQGAGVMEFFAILLTRRQGATVSQAFALTMSIRLVQMFWNLVCGIIVFRGGYHAPTQKEAEELQTDGVGEPAPAPATEASATM